MNAYKLSDGNYLIPKRAESEDGDIGDSVEVITPDHPEFKNWSKFVKPASREINNAYSTKK